ncbi:MAG TPA: hypothetical protein VGF20_15740 [Candidatus Acidoferrum sp.]|jgi:hypothetical protein
MSRKLAVLAAMIILVGAMGLKTVVAGKNHGSVNLANGAAPPPPTPWMMANGAAPPPPTPWK